MLEFSLSEKVKNHDLQKLKPLYQELIQDIRANKEKSVYLSPLFDETAWGDDERVVLLHLIDYLSQVRAKRAFSHPQIFNAANEIFQLVDISEELLQNKVLGHWCRIWQLVDLDIPITTQQRILAQDESSGLQFTVILPDDDLPVLSRDS